MQWDRENDETGQFKPDMPQEGPREPEERPGVIWEEEIAVRKHAAAIAAGERAVAFKVNLARAA